MIYQHHLLVLLLFLLLDGTLATMTAFALIPSQVPGAAAARQQQHARPTTNEVDEKATTTAPLLATSDDSVDSGDSLAGDRVVYAAPLSSESLASTTASSSSSSKNSRRKKKIPIPRTGNFPDVHWRAISMSHLRSHPNFQPLPPPSMINRLPTKEYVRYFRQDSWQWADLHTGRCTTSQAASALGFLEPKAAQFLGIPKSLQRGGTSAWDRLRHGPEEDDQSLAAMEQILCEGRSSLDNDEVVGSWRPGARESERLWVPASRLRIDGGATRTRPFPFAAKYIPNLTREELYQRKMYLKQQRHHLSPSPMKTRMQWGNAQEATSILTALNYFCGEDGGTTIHEVGMCGAGFDDEIDDPLLQGVKIGASPDAIISHGDGTVEVLEVKNHCPFVWNRISPHFTSGGGAKKQHSNKSGSRQKKNKGKKLKSNKDDGQQSDEGSKQGGQRDEGAGLPKHYLIRDFQLERKIPPIYIPQLMMEMLCVGDAIDLDDANSKSDSSKLICTSAVMVRQTATKGAILLRLERDEEWIQEMKYWLGKFKAEYVDTGIIPHDNFFYDDDPDSRYQKFLRRTIQLSESVEQVAYIDHGRIQRMVLDRGVGDESMIPLFLDRVYESD